MFRRICTGTVALTVVVWLVVPASADVIYYDSFTRGTPDEPMLLNYSEPEVRSGTLGGSDYARWFSFIPTEGLPWATRGARAELGYSDQTSPIAASWLRFTPLDGYVYTYSMQMNCIYNPAGGSTQDWLAIGFLNNPDDGGMAWFSGAGGPNVSAAGYLQRSHAFVDGDDGQYGPAFSFLGPNTYDGEAFDLLGEHTFKITLDTRETLWTASWDVDNGAYTRGPVAYATNPTITHLGFGNGGGRGYVDDVRLYGGLEPEPSPIPGDANLDWVVDDEDASILGKNWLVQSGADWSMGDFNRDKKVNDADAAIMAAHWGQRAAEGASVPEPSAVALLLGALVSLFVWRRRG